MKPPPADECPTESDEEAASDASDSTVAEPPEPPAPPAPSEPTQKESEGEAERRQITSRAGIVAAGTLASRVLGLVRDQVLAALFSRGATDAFFAAFTIPNVLRKLLAEGAVQTAVLPVLSAVREQQGEEEARRFFRAIQGLSFLVLTVVTVVGVVAAPWLVEAFAGGYRDDPGKFERTVTLTRWLFPYIFFMGVAAFGLAALNTYKRFVVTSFAPGLLNVAFIAFVLLLPDWLGARGYDRILAMAFGALVGGVLQVIAQWPSLRAIGYLQWPSLEFRHPGVRQALQRMIPVLFGIGVYWVDVMLARRFLSELGEGAQSAFAYALRLCDSPQGIFVMALQSATLPSLALLAAREDEVELGKTFAYGMRLTLFVALPATMLLVVLAEPLVILIFERGEFTRVASIETAKALMALGAGVWTVAAVRQLVSVFYAVGDTRSPVVASTAAFVTFVSLALLLRGPLGHVGIALGVTGASTVQMLLLWLLIGKHLPSLHLREVGTTALRTVIAAAAASAMALVVVARLAPFLSGGGLSRLVPGVVGALAFGATYFIAAWIVRCPELSTVLSPLARRVLQRVARSR